MNMVLHRRTKHFNQNFDMTVLREVVNGELLESVCHSFLATVISTKIRRFSIYRRGI